MTALLEVRELSKSFRRGPEEVHALDHVSFTVRPGEVVALMGPSGSGKTTLLNLLCGWERPDSGEMLWRGEPCASPADLPWGELAILPQDLGLIEELSIRENVEIPVRLGARADQHRAAALSDRAAALIDGLGLAELADRAPSEVSLGEQQRSALGRALVLRPAMILADEPTGHQDERWGRLVFRTLHMAAAEGTASLVATHNADVLRTADRLLAIRDGRLHETPLTRAMRSEAPPSHAVSSGDRWRDA